MTSASIALILITLLAATVNGALGYGFSSITVPVALLFFTNRVLNPALVWIEVPLNAYVLWVNRASIPNVWRRVLPMIIGLAPGFRRPIRAERRAGLLFGGGLGVLYSVTTVSGPPLAIMLNNQGLAKRDFRAALGLVRLAESTMTAVAYYFVSMYSVETAGLLPYILPSLAFGIPLGTWIIRRVRPETFRRICMSFDAWVVGFGISTLLQQLRLVESGAAYAVLATVALIDLPLLYRFFRIQLPQAIAARAGAAG